ncbi:MAG: hypothetical protein JSR46_09005 [Verrucomicrobia bacterium]|nr:hypothetical protein [Verrucomicrobiota bacterium]
MRGRDWYDVVWFIRREIPLNMSYLAKYMHENNQLTKNETLTPERLLQVFAARLKQIDLEDAKRDVRPFLRDASQLDEWSEEFFLYWFSKIIFTDLKTADEV